MNGGEHVYAVLRTADSGYIGLRDPSNVSTTIWVPSSALVQTDFSSLPIGGCGMASIEPVPVVVAPPVVTPGKPSKPGAPKDTTKPTVGKPSVDNAANNNCYARVIVTASDNVAVTSVSISWSGHNTGSGQMTSTGGHWQYLYQGGMYTTNSGPTTFTVVAHDAAGNSSLASSSDSFRTSPASEEP